MLMELKQRKVYEGDIGQVNLCVHGHFYQPPRENPFTGIIPVEEGATPFANFNERITNECYRPNAEAGTFDMMSFDLGPTLASWLEKAHPDVYQRIIGSDRTHMQRYGVGNALAQAYNHTILPLASIHDKRTQILWGLRDFRQRFGRKARGMWLAETAVDQATLDILAGEGVEYTILAPWQAAVPVNPTEPYLVRLSGGRSMTVFFYNDLSGPLSYCDEWTVDANLFASSYQHFYVHETGRPQMHVIATDGELYGHHKPWRDKFLAHFLQRSAPAYGLEICSLERYLLAHPASREIEVREPSSWSCYHGVDRWIHGCTCTEGESRWKSPFRQALVNVHTQINDLFEQYASETLANPWEARNDYLALRNGWETAESFWEYHGKHHCPPQDIRSVLRTMQLLEAQFYLQYSFTSCGFFFEDLDRLEPQNNIAFARRAISLIWQALGIDLQQDFLRDLSAAKSWRTGATGADLYRRLPAVPPGFLAPTVLEYYEASYAQAC